MNDYFLYFSLSFWSTLMVLVVRQNEPNATDTECHQINIIISLDKVHINKTLERHALPYTEGGNVCFQKDDLALCIKIKNSLTL